MRRRAERRSWRTWLYGVLALVSGFLVIAGPQQSRGAPGEAASVDPTTAPLQDSWPQVQGNARHAGYVPQTVGPPYQVLWRRDTPPVSGRVQPIIAAGLVFLPSNDGCLYALSTADGDTAWSYCTGAPLVNSAAYANGRVFFGSTNHFVYAVNTNGTLAWRYETGSTVKSAPVAAAGRVFIGSSDGYMYALEQATGVRAWRYPVGAPIYDTAAYDNGRVFFGGMDSAGYALEAGDGTLAWRVPIPGQGFRDRWTVAGNDHVFFTPMIYGSHHGPLSAGTALFHADADPVIYDQPWSVQRQAILDHLVAAPYYQPLFVVDQVSGTIPFTPPAMYASGGSESPHSQVALLPNGNANVVYRRSFGEPAQWGATTHDALFTGELDLSDGDVIPVDRCEPGGGGWADCGNYKSAFTSDESSALVRSGDVIYLDIARGTYGLDTASETMLPTIACYSDGMGSPFYLPECLVTYDDYLPPPAGWRVHYDDLESEVSSDGNDVKRPTPIVGDTLYVLHYNHLAAVEGTIAGAEVAPPADSSTPDNPTVEAIRAAPHATNLLQELELRISEVISAGHMAPTLYFNGLGGGGTQMGGPAIFYATPNETLYTLSAAYPHLSPALQAQLKAYLDAELSAYPSHSQGYYPPYAGTVADLVGTPREYFVPNPGQSFNMWPPPSVHVSVLYSLWLYSSNTGDWNYVTSNYDTLRSVYTDFKSSSGDTIASYPELSGVLGFARIAQHLGHTADHDDAWTLAQQGFAAGADFEQFLELAHTRYPTGTHSYTAQVFMFNRNPLALHFDRDIGLFLRDHATPTVAAYAAQIAHDVPLWWLTGVSLSHGENAYATPEIAWTNFMLQAYVLEARPEQLAAYLDAPDRKGDLLYIQKLLASIEAQGPPDLSLSFKAPSSPAARAGEVVTYTVVVRNDGSALTSTVHLTDTVPAGLSYVSGTLTATLGMPDEHLAPTLRWSGTLSGSNGITITYAVTVAAATPQIIQNTAAIFAQPTGPLTRTATILVNGQSLYLPLVIKGANP